MLRLTTTGSYKYAIAGFNEFHRLWTSSDFIFVLFSPIEFVHIHLLHQTSINSVPFTFMPPLGHVPFGARLIAASATQIPSFPAVSIPNLSLMTVFHFSIHHQTLTLWQGIFVLLTSFTHRSGLDLLSTHSCINRNRCCALGAHNIRVYVKLLNLWKLCDQL